LSNIILKTSCDCVRYHYFLKETQVKSAFQVQRFFGQNPSEPKNPSLTSISLLPIFRKLNVLYQVNFWIFFKIKGNSLRRHWITALSKIRFKNAEKVNLEIGINFEKLMEIEN